ncbi:MAG TPA: AAA family ATPase [Pseudonocardia sp.]|nr:AAA family ATPase [Pseudonocardia sp.]
MTFVGRAAQLAALRSGAEDAVAGRARVVWIEGEAGAGKTALLDRATDALPPAFTVLRAEADELGADVAFGLVEQLAPRTAAAPFAVGLELLDRWSGADGPVAVVVEDLHWADAPSREALLTAARRLSRDRVLLVVTSRPGADVDGWERLRLDPRRCTRIEVGALTVAEVGALAASQGVPLPTRAAERLHRHTGGHALYVRTLLAELEPARLVEGDGDLPAPRSLSTALVARLSGLPAPARELGLALAVLGRAAPLALVGAVAGVAGPTAALDDLLGAGLATWQAGPGAELRFAHPLYRAALLDDLSPTRRRTLHRAAAGLLGGGEALGHRVAAADGFDAELAADLRAQAHRERGRAAQYLRWASTVDPVRERAEQALLDAVRLLVEDGRPLLAAQLRERVEACAESPRRQLVAGMLDREAGRGEAAERALRQAADEGGPDVAAAALSQLVTLYVDLGRGPEAVAAAERLLALDPAAEQVAHRGLALGEMFVRGAPAGLARLTARLPQPADEVPASDIQLLVTRGTLGFYAGRVTAAIADLRAGIRLARQVNAAPSLPRAHLQLANLLLHSGAWDEATVHARVALSLVSDERRVWMEPQVHAVLGRLHACRGEWAEAAEHVGAATSAAAVNATAEAVFTASIARATLARARGEPREVLAAFAPILGNGRALPMATTLAWWPPIIAATVDVGDTAAAQAQLDRLRAAAEERGLDLEAQTTGLAAMIALRGGDTPGAAEGFARAVARAGPDVNVLDRADLHHRYGRLLVGTGRRRDGTEQLQRAGALLAGAEPFRARVEADLAAAGLRPPRHAPRSPRGLTDRERDVVALVARGLSNREAAAELYVSAKAVEYHLGNVYAKLGIRSRRELRDLLREPEPQEN